jgi:hypothetical protein
MHVSLCVCVCVCARACARVCICISIYVMVGTIYLCTSFDKIKNGNKICKDSNTNFSDRETYS